MDLVIEVMAKIILHFQQDWNKDYVLDLIGREYCRDRSIACEKQEYDQS